MAKQDGTGSIGLHLQAECHKLTYSKQSGCTLASEFSTEEKELLLLRTGLEDHNFISACTHHRVLYLDKYELKQTQCCDPYKVHKTAVKKNLRKVTLSLTKKGQLVNKKVIPGKKICLNCLKKLNAIQDEDDSSSTSSDNQSVIDLSETVAVEHVAEKLNLSLVEMDQSPIKMHSLSTAMRAPYVKRKLSDLHSKYRQPQSTDLHSKVLKLDDDILSSDLATTSATTATSVAEMEKDAAALNDLMAKLKTKINKPETTRAHKIQMLTLVPLTWSQERITGYFQVSQR